MPVIPPLIPDVPLTPATLKPAALTPATLVPAALKPPVPPTDAAIAPNVAVSDGVSAEWREPPLYADV